MKDRSGRECKLGDLMLGIGNKKVRLEQLEYSIVVGEGKVFNGTSCYTIGEYGYLCALTPKELEIQKKLQMQYQEKTLGGVKRKENAKLVKYGTMFKVGDTYYIYLGKVMPSIAYHSGKTLKSVYEKGGHCYFVLDTGRYSTKVRTESVYTQITNTHKFDVSMIPSLCGELRGISNYDGEFGLNYNDVISVVVKSSKIDKVDKVIGEIELLNWDVGNEICIKMYMAYNNATANQVTIRKL